jgi:hypothetical protein
MSIGAVFLVLALILFALLGMGVTVIPRAEAWGLFCLTLGLLTGGWPLSPWPWPPRA